MTVKELIKELLDYDMNSEVTVSCLYNKEKSQKEKCKGAMFDIKCVDDFGGTVEIIFFDWRKKGESE